MNNARKLLPLLAIVSALPVFSGCDSDNGGGDVAGATFLVSVAKTGSGQGLVSSSDPGINCGADCAQNYAQSTTVSLTATPQPGSSFVSWSGVAGCTTATICTFTVSGDVSVVAAFTLSTAQGTLGEIVAVNTANELLSFNRQTPNNIQTRVAVSPALAVGEQLVGVDYRPGDIGATDSPKVYGLIKGTTTSRVVALNPQTGVVSASIVLVPDPADTAGEAPYTNLTGTDFGMDFDPAADRLRVVSDTGENLRVRLFDDPATGGTNEAGFTITDAALSGAVTGATGAAYTSNFAGAPGTVLMLIADDKLLIQNPPSDGTTTLVAALSGGVSDIGAITGFDITGDADFNTLGYLAATDTDGAGNTEFYEVNLFNGATTFKGAIGLGNEVIRGVAIVPAQPQLSLGDALALTSDNRLLSFNRAVPASGPFAFRTGVNISGLRAGEDVIGIDHRPVDGLLYAVGNLGGAGRIYTVNPASGFATVVADINVALGGSSFGVGFKPTTDQIRIVSSGSQNLAVNPLTGEAVVMTNLSRDGAAPAPAPRVGATATASAFTNALAGVASTVHFALDTASDVLVTVREAAAFPDVVNNPQGELINVPSAAVPGTLGVDASSVNGFDIDPMSGIAFAALLVGSESALYSIDLTAGTVTKLALLGGGTVAMEGLAMVPPTGPFIYGVIDDAGQKLVKFSPTYPGTFLPFTGVAGSPDRVAIMVGASPIAGTVMGMDFHVVAGAPDLLFALVRDGSEDKVYLIDTATGAATLQVTLAASPDDPTNPYAAPLGGAIFGIDFSPTVALAAASLRLVTDTELNVRANAVSGETFTDSNLVANSVPNPNLQIAALAFTNNVSGAESTRAYVIDQNGSDNQGRLGILGVDPNPSISTENPANGNVVNVDDSTQLVDPFLDALSIVPGSKLNFDIIGPNNLLPFASIKVGDSPDATNPATQLFRVSLSSGAGTVLGPIGDGSKDVLGLSILLEPLGD